MKLSPFVDETISKTISFHAVSNIPSFTFDKLRKKTYVTYNWLNGLCPWIWLNIIKRSLKMLVVLTQMNLFEFTIVQDQVDLINV